MVLTIERAGFIRRQPSIARSIEVLVEPKHLPELLRGIRHNHCAAVLVAAATVAGAVGLARHPVSCANPANFDAPAARRWDLHSTAEARKHSNMSERKSLLIITRRQC